MIKPISPVSEDQVRDRLQKRRVELAARQSRVETDRTHRVDSLSADSSEQAIQLENEEALAVIDRAALQEIQAIDAALERLEKGLYAVCKRCGGAIGPARLNAVPYAITCEPCAR